MKQEFKLQIVASVFLLLVLATALPVASARPHIVLLVADDLGWGDVGYHGSSIATPHIDGLAARGAQLNQFYVQPVCSPTRGALLSGRYPMRLGLQCGVVRPWATHGLPLDERTLPEALRDVGYATAICGKWHLGHSRPEYLPTRRGFDHQYGHYNGMLDYFTHIRDGGHDWHRDDEPNHDEGYATDLIAAEAVRLIKAHDVSRPLFLYVPFNAPHTPLQAPPEYLQKYASVSNEKRRAYAAMVTALDDALGRIVDALNTNHYRRTQTLLFFCSDNGGVRRHGSNGELRGGKGTLYEGGIRVPAIMVLQNEIRAGTIVSQPIHIVDLFPTLVNLAGGTTQRTLPLDGQDVWPTIVAGQESPHEFILHNLTPFQAAIRVGGWKLIRNGELGANATEAPARDNWELFQVDADPSESQDLLAEHPAVVARLQTRLEDLADEAAPPHILTDRPPADFKVPAIWGHTE